MIDLNDLKVTNDTLGHERGDDIIVGLCRIVQCVFTKSSIYRIGGDEFVVISEKEDLKNIQQLEERFVDMIDKSTKAARQDFAISAAIGVAIYNSKVDNNVEDTFKRADAAMYKNKKTMKEPR
jgi:diguanylate cyclase (GGDEF)-like protein